MPRTIRILSLLAAITCLVATGTAIIVLADYMATLSYYARVANGMAQIVDVKLRLLAQGADVALARTAGLVQAAGGSANLRDEIAWHRIRTNLDPVVGADSIWVVDRHGDVMLESSSFPGNTINVADRSYFAAAQRGTALFIGPAIRSRFTNRVVITMTRGLLDRNGEFDGLAGITVDAEWLVAFYALLEPELRPDIAIFRGDGSVVLANRDLAALIGTDVADSPYWRPLLAPPAAAMPARLDPARQLVDRLEIPAYDLKVVIRLDAQEALARLVVRTRNTTIVAALGAILLFAVMLFGIRSFERERAAVAVARQAASDLAMARHDALTGLASRGLFFELSAALAARTARDAGALGALYIDLDGFKLVNDRLGHDRGDRVLVETAQAIAGAIRAGDIAGRIGGDEFVVCLAAAPDAIGHALSDVAERIRLGIAAIGDGIACSIGMASAPAGSVDLPVLLRRADGAMRQAKARGKNQTAAS